MSPRRVWRQHTFNAELGHTDKGWKQLTVECRDSQPTFHQEGQMSADANTLKLRKSQGPQILHTAKQPFRTSTKTKHFPDSR